MTRREGKLLSSVAAFAAATFVLLVGCFAGVGDDNFEYILMLLYGAAFALLGGWIFDVVTSLASKKKDRKEVKLLEEK